MLCAMRFAALLLERAGTIFSIIDFRDRLHGFGRKLAVRIMLQVILECGLGLLGVFQIITIYFADGEESFHAMLAAGILAAQEGKLPDGIFVAFGIIEYAALSVP